MEFEGIDLDPIEALEEMGWAPASAMRSFIDRLLTAAEEKYHFNGNIDEFKEITPIRAVGS